ncbi:MAG: DUF2752 domain-containing protein [Nocardioidaceae bacterium]|nr:DUF2752 domain-containing protein [Nocardioidaceae bacterium]
MRAVTLVGLLGAAAAVAMAVFGLPPVDLHGPLHRMGIMDPLCGGTRAARLTAQGHLSEAWRYNPLGILAVAAAGLAVLRLVVGVLGHRWLNVSIHWSARGKWVTAALVIALLVMLEIRQQGHADLLLQLQ